MRVFTTVQSLLEAIARQEVDPAFAEVLLRRELRRFDLYPQTPTGFNLPVDLTERSGKGVPPPDGDTEECA
jgi:hypothetical protein